MLLLSWLLGSILETTCIVDLQVQPSRWEGTRGRISKPKVNKCNFACCT